MPFTDYISKEEAQAIAKDLASAGSKIATIAGFIMLYYYKENKWINLSGSITSLIGYLCDYGVDYLKNESARSQLVKSQNRFEALTSNYPNIADVISSNKWYKIHGVNLDNTSSLTMNAVAPISIIASTITSIANTFLPKAGFQTTAIATGVVGLSLSYINQFWTTHNLKHEKELYEKAHAEIIDVVLNNKSRNTNTITYKR